MPDAGMPASSTARHRAAAAAASAAFKVYMNSPLIWNSLSVVDDNRHTVTCKLWWGGICWFTRPNWW